MAAGKSILKLVVDDKEYGSKLKNAQNALNALEAVLQGTGKSFAQVDKAVVDYAKSIGQMSAQATSARGKIGEMTSTFTELSLKYRQLTEEEKKSPFGQALSASLDQLRTRIQDNRQQLDDVTRSLSDTKQEGGATSGIMEQLAGKFTISLDAVKLFNVGLQATQSVLSVAKDAFFNNEEQLDEWGRVVESGESVYKAFLNSINTGDIGGFLSKIDSIVSAARQAYDALDELATYNAFNQVNVEKTRTGMTESIADYREGNGTKEAVRAAGDAYKKELRDRQKMEHDAYVAKIKQVAAERGVSFTDLQKALSGTYGDYRTLKNVPMTGTRLRVSGPFSFGAGNVSTEKYAANERERLGEALRHLNDTELQSLQALGAQAERTGNEVAQVDKQLARVLRGNGSGGSTTTRTPRSVGGGGNTYDPLAGSIDYQAKKVQELQKAWRAAADDDSRQKIKKEIEKAQFVLDILTGKTSGIPKMNYGVGQLAGKKGSGVYQGGFELAKNDSKSPWQLNEKAMKALGNEIACINGKREGSLTKELGNISSGISGIMGGMESLGIELPQGMKDVVNGIQAVVSILTGISSIITAIQTISTANLFKVFAGGGVVRAAGGFVSGNNFSGDMIPALLNSGEVVLNRAQQGNLVSQLQKSDNGMRIVGKLSGEDIVLVVNRFFRRTGQGEILTWKG